MEWYGFIFMNVAKFYLSFLDLKKFIWFLYDVVNYGLRLNSYLKNNIKIWLTLIIELIFDKSCAKNIYLNLNKLVLYLD